MATITELADERFCITLRPRELGLLLSCIGHTPGEAPKNAYYDALLAFAHKKLSIPETLKADVYNEASFWDGVIDIADIAYSRSTMRFGEAPKPTFTCVLAGPLEDAIEMECSKEEFLILWATLSLIMEDCASSTYNEANELLGDADDWDEEIRSVRETEFTDDSAIVFD